MLRSGNNDLLFIAVPDLKEPCTTSLADHRSGPAMETGMRHSFLNARLTDDVHLLADLKLLNKGGYRQDTPPSLILLELISRLLSWSIVMCHVKSLHFSAIYLYNVKLAYPGKPSEDLSEAWPGPTMVP